MRAFASRWLWGAICVSVLLQIAVVEIGFMKLAFGTAQLSAAQWALCAAMASVVLGCRELHMPIGRLR